MRLSASILEDFPVCEYRTKLRYFDHEPTPLTRGDLYSLYLGRLAHAGQDAILTGGVDDAAPAVCHSAVKELGSRCTPEEARDLIRRAVGMAVRWARWHQPERFASRTFAGHPIVNYRLVLPLRPAIGVFDEYVVQPDRVCQDADGATWLYDWKWTSKLGSEEAETEALRFDLQSVVYQHGLAEAGIEVRGVAHVRGLTAEPTPFRVTKAGVVARTRVRNSWEEYERACVAAGHEPDTRMHERLLPFFREPRIYRSATEVRNIWQQVIVPRAQAISDAIETRGFQRRMTRGMCARCPYQGPCWEGVMGRGEGPFASAFIVPRSTSSEVTAADLS